MRLRALPLTLAASVLGLASATAADLLWNGAPRTAELALDAGATLLLPMTIALAIWIWSRRHRAGEALRRAEARNRAIVEGAGEAIIVIDAQARITTFNGAAEALFGYAASEILGSSLEQLMTDGARQAHAAYLERTGVTAMVEAVRHRTVHKGLRKTGEVFPFELAMTEWSEDGRRMFTGVLRDVTERERAAAALRESQARYAGLYDGSAEMLFIYTVGSDGGFALESMNRTAEARTGVSRSVLAGLTPDQLTMPDEARGLKRALLQCLASGLACTHEMKAELKDEIRDLHVTLSPMRDGAGEITRILAAARELNRPAERQAA